MLLVFADDLVLCRARIEDVETWKGRARNGEERWQRED